MKKWISAVLILAAGLTVLSGCGNKALLGASPSQSGTSPTRAVTASPRISLGVSASPSVSPTAGASETPGEAVSPITNEDTASTPAPSVFYSSPALPEPSSQVPPSPPAPEPTAATDKQGYNKGEIMPDFSVTMLDGSTYTLSNHRGKVVFINLFATWCGPCVSEMPDIQKLYSQYGSKADFIVIDTGGETAATAAAFLKKNSYTFPAAVSSNGKLGSYDVQFIPQTFILDRSGKIAYYYSGKSDFASFSGALNELTR